MSSSISARPVALVTGGSRGIGRGICLELAKAGYAIAIHYASNEAAALQTQSLLGQDAVSCVLQADIAVTIERVHLVDQVLQQFGRIDALVNNAGIPTPERIDLLDTSEVSWDRVLGVNLKGPFFLSQHVAREMVRLLPQLRSPTIVNISSISAYTASVFRADYCVSKSALGMVTQLFAARLGELGIRVYEVRPGIIETDMTALSRDKYDRLIREGLTPIRRWGTPADVGQAVAALVTGQFPFSTGNPIDVDGGFHVRQL